jgi:hypothetical protein
LRPSNIDGASGAKEEVERIITQIRGVWPKTRIIIRADSGFCREDIMVWCEDNNVDYILGLARNARLVKEISEELKEAKVLAAGGSAKIFKEFKYKTVKSWRQERRVVGKAEWLTDKENPRFIVTSLLKEYGDGEYLYKKVYCARGDMENRIKECQLDLFSDRTSTASIASNQLRLWFASMAYVLISALRRIALTKTQFATATCGTIRLKLLKIGALVSISVRRIKISISSSYPWRDEWAEAHARLSTVLV